jgi:hypothetical protein
MQMGEKPRGANQARQHARATSGMRAASVDLNGRSRSVDMRTAAAPFTWLAIPASGDIVMGSLVGARRIRRAFAWKTVESVFLREAV